MTATPFVGNRAGQKRDDNGLKMKLVWCPPGKFMMGEPDNEDGMAKVGFHVQVTLTKGFWLGETQVTQSQWQKVMGTMPWSAENLLTHKDVTGGYVLSNYDDDLDLDDDDVDEAEEYVKEENDFVKEGDDFPASYVSWEDAMKSCDRFTKKEHRAGRLPTDWKYILPTDAQWEYACRAGTTTTFSFGDHESDLAKYAWFEPNAAKVGEKYAHQVGQKKPNGFGLHDMHGNVIELCRDSYVKEPPGGKDPEVFANESGRHHFIVVRGGSWETPAFACRSADRWFSPLMLRSNEYGFRMTMVQSGK